LIADSTVGCGPFHAHDLRGRRRDRQRSQRAAARLDLVEVLLQVPGAGRYELRLARADLSSGIDHVLVRGAGRSVISKVLLTR
jgi:hypothetical protein